MKKTTAIILVLLTILSIAIPRSYAAENTSPSTVGEDLQKIGPNDVDELMEDGTSSYTVDDGEGNKSTKSKTVTKKWRNQCFKGNYSCVIIYS